MIDTLTSIALFGLSVYLIVTSRDFHPSNLTRK